MAGPGEYENIFELVNPLKPYIRGVCALIHDADEFDEGASYLLKVNNELGAGNVIFGPYTGRHDLSRNRILAETGIQEGDYLIIIDTLERCPVEFAEKLSEWHTIMTRNKLDVIRFHAKPYLVIYREDMFYIGAPHENFTANNALVQIDLANYPEYQDESKVRVNMRPIKRKDNPYHWCSHYMKYLLAPNSNQNLLGLEHHGGAAAFPYLESIRKKLVKLLRDRGLTRDLNGVTMLFSVLDGEVRELVNNHKTLNDYYRYAILNDKTIKDDHSQTAWDNMPKF